MYKKGIDEENRSYFRKALKEELEGLITQYYNDISEAQHIKNIESLADKMSKDYSEILKDGRFRIGSAQKILNMYLKYIWCIEGMPTPPHCPFDAIVLQQVPEYKNIRWTQLDCINAYKDMVKHSKIVAGDEIIAEWELNLYNEIR